jgi:hypothetical protein
MVPVTSDIIQLINPGCQVAIDRAVHDVDEERFHRRITGACPYCLTMSEKLAKAFRDNVAGSDIAIHAREWMIALMDAQDQRADA